MRILYVAPRFHTNQRSIVKGWVNDGNEVDFISYYSVKIEDHSVVEPVVLGFSPWFYAIDWVYMNIIKRNDPAKTAFKINHGFPPISKIRRMLKEMKPDLVIMRDRTLYSMVTYHYCKKYGYKSILYYQSPLWNYENRSNDLIHRLVRNSTPKYCMTPVMGSKGAGRVVLPNTFFVPFVVDPQIAPKDKMYFKDDRINILSIGKFEPRKHHMMISKVIGELAQQIYSEHFKLTIIGEAHSDLQKKHFTEVTEFIRKNGLESLVEIVTNVPRSEMDKYYVNTDLFVIPSTKENASISQLEAMSFSIPVICSDTNGSSCYVDDGVNGFIFKDCDEKDLKEKIFQIVSDRNKIVQMGAESYRLVTKKYVFKNYKEGIENILKAMSSEE